MSPLKRAPQCSKLNHSDKVLIIIDLPKKCTKIINLLFLSNQILKKRKFPRIKKRGTIRLMVLKGNHFRYCFSFFDDKSLFKTCTVFFV